MFRDEERTIAEQKLYDALVEDICANEEPVYYNLALFVQDHLKKQVQSWCYGSVLYGGKQYEDIMQEIHIRIIKYCESYFFKPVNGKTTKTCEEFKKWTYVVAKNYFRTYCEKSKRDVVIDIDDIDITDCKFTDESEDLDANHEALRDAFSVVMDLSSGAHIILTWLSLSLFMICDWTKIESTHLLPKKFNDASLSEMFDYVIEALLKLEWLEISEAQIEKQKRKLSVIHPKTGKEIGSMKYSEFYMAKGAEKSISDWVNRINEQIKKRIDKEQKNETDGSKIE